MKNLKEYTPKTISGWIVFLIMNVSAITILFSGVKELAIDGYFLMYGGSREAQLEEKIQNKLWIKNKECYKETSPFTFITDDKEKLSILICKDSGDIYVELVPKMFGRKITHRWIEIPRESSPNTFNDINLVSSLVAQEKKPTFLQRQIKAETGLLCREIYKSFAVEIRQYEDQTCTLIKKWYSGKIETRDISCSTPCSENI